MAFRWILERRGLRLFALENLKVKNRNSSVFCIVKLGLLVILYDSIDIKINRYDL